MRLLSPARGPVTAALVLALLAGPPAASADLRISDFDVFLNDNEVTIHFVLLGAVPPSFAEGIQSGIPTQYRYTVELWQYNRLWRDSLLIRKVIVRQLDYNVVAKEFKVTTLRGETRPPHLTRELHDAQRVISEVRGVKLTPATAVDPNEILYVRVQAEAALNGEHTWVGRMSGTAEQASRQSEYRTIFRRQ
ncbi:MAG: DUF4390 domain-containing protein [Candidatus Rokuibacteriota bacterium]